MNPIDWLAALVAAVLAVLVYTITASVLRTRHHDAQLPTSPANPHWRDTNDEDPR
jgi:hypothetical protein